MSVYKYYKTFHRNHIVFIIVSFACIIGVIPAFLIKIRANVIEGAKIGLVEGNARFWSIFWIYILLFFLSIIIKHILVFISERYDVSIATKLDRLLLEKANRVTYGISETEKYHSLFQQASKASELNSKCSKAVQIIIQSIIHIVSSLVVIATIDFSLMLGILILLLLSIGLNLIQSIKTQGIWSKYIENIRRSNYFSSLLLQHEYAAERKIFSYEDTVDRYYTESFHKASKKNSKIGKNRLWIEMTTQLVFVVYIVMIIVLLMKPLSNGIISLGLFTSLFYSASGLVQCCTGICSATYDYSECMEQFKGYFDFMLLSEKENIESSNNLHNFKLKTIEFCDVSFTYPNQTVPIIDHLSLKLEAGKHYALVGENGSGKSTLVKLITGLYEPSHGEILINEKRIKEFSGEEISQIMSVVFQDYYKYPLTIRENVSLCSKEQLSDEQLDRIFNTLEFDYEKLNLTSGYDTNLLWLKQGGINISGGEWQKLTIARCILSNSMFCILDEPNASLDPLSEIAVYRAYKPMLAGKTSMFISHRLGSARLSDEILVLKDGCIIAKAPHDQLMEECSYYADLYNTQKEMYHGSKNI